MATVTQADLTYYWERACQHNRELLIRSIEDLAADLTLQAKRMRDYDHRPSGAGIIQGRGSDIDAQCARYGQMVEIVKSMKAIQEAPIETTKS